MEKTRSYKKHLTERLKDPKEAVAYLNETLKDEDPKIFLKALRDVVEAHGGITLLTKKAD